MCYLPRIQTPPLALSRCLLAKSVHCVYLSCSILGHITNKDVNRTFMQIKLNSKNFPQVYPNAIWFHLLQFCPPDAPFRLFCVSLEFFYSFSIVFNRYCDILVYSVTSSLTLQLPDIEFTATKQN